MTVAGARFWLAVAALTIAAACGSDGPAAPVSGEGTVTGKVTAADGVTPVALASVYAESKGQASAVTSGTDGSYTLTQVPAGTQVIVAVKGNFRATTQVSVKAGATTAAPVAKLAPQGKLGFVAGSFDDIQAIIRTMGYSADSLASTALASATTLAQYKMLFLNCGAGISTDVQTVNALKAWVHAGGTLYASDFELDVIQAMFPTDIPQSGSGDAQNITATITSTALQQFTGKSTAGIAYDAGGWRMLVGISSNPSVLLRGTVTGMDDATLQQQTFTNQALAISIAHGQGRVVFTTFHNSKGVTADQLTVLRYFIHF